ncbi:MAG: DNA recombination protein RmuC [Candidatus Omnitrophica bacterium]|nr:DNA recombination protein RmuC [Candidatus Omnitrophota bacterium]
MIVVVTGAIVLIAAILFFISWFIQTRTQSHLWMKHEIEALRGDFKESLNHLITQVNDRLRDNTSLLGQRLDTTVKVVGSISEHLGRLHEASARILEVGKDISSLQELLRAPKIRGGLGEYFLSDLLSQIMPKEFYQTPYAFKNGQLVDAAIKFGQNLVPIDAKFPLENFRAMLSAVTDDQRKSARKQFISDVKKHISDISSKYIVPDEGTFDFALMYIPAENVYYETIIKDDKFVNDTGLFQYALGKKVIPVSPNSLYAYLQVILLGLKGMAIEKNTRHILANLGKLKMDFDRFSDEFLKLGKHLVNSRGSFDDAEKRLAKIQEKLLQLSGMENEKTLESEQKVSI